MIKGLPDKLKAYRAQLGLSQKQLAEKIGVSPSIVSGYETGLRTPSTESLLSLAYLFNTSTDYLLGKQTTPPESVVDVSKLTEKQKAAIAGLIDSI